MIEGFPHESAYRGVALSSPAGGTFSMTPIALRDGRRVCIRPLLPGEERPIRELHARLSPRSRYFRYLSPMPALPDSLVRALADVDDERRLSLVAESADEARETLAIASASAMDEATAEVGLAVRDEWQGQGLGTELASRLLDAAVACGFRCFIATMHAHNVAIRRVVDRVGVVVSSRLEGGGVSELWFIRRASG